MAQQAVKKIFDRDTMTAPERLAAAIALQKPDRVPLSLMLYHFAPRHVGVKMGDFINRPDVYMSTMRRLYKDLGPWDIYYNTNPVSRLIYTYVMMVWNSLPGLELEDDELPREEEVPYMQPEDYDRIISSPSLAADTLFRLRMLPRFCKEAQGLGLAGVGLKMLGQALRQLRYWRKDFAWWRSRGLAVQSGYQAEMPFDIFSQGRSIVHFSMDLFKVPEKIGRAAEKMAAGYGTNAALMARLHGVPRVQCYCTRSSNNFISPQQFEQLVLPAIEIVVDKIVSAGMTPILHCDGDWLKNLNSMRRLPEKKVIVQLDGTTDIFRAKEEIGDRVCLFGDVPAAKLVMGSPNEVEEYCHKLIEVAGRGGGFILGAGCEIPPNARADNIRAMVKSVYKYGYYPSAG